MRQIARFLNGADIQSNHNPDASMKKLIAEIWRHPQGFLGNTFYCHGDDGELDRAITQTLLSLIQEASSPSDEALEVLVSTAEAGRYAPRDPTLPDWGVNDKNVWLVEPMAKSGHICIANENTEEYSTEEGGQPQQFSFAQFRAALKHWREFQALVASEGKDKLLGQRYEALFPD